MSLHHATTLIILAASQLAFAEPLVTPAAQLAPRATDPSFVGYISESGSYGNSRSCDYPQTVSTSNGYVQCCPTSGACPFYTSCSNNILLGGPTTVPCDVDPGLTCNTAIVLPTVSAASSGLYLACWQTTLGSNAFTIVQSLPSGASVAAPTSTASSGATSTSGSSLGSAAATTSGASQTSAGSSSSSSGTTSAASSSSSKAGAAFADVDMAAGLVGAVGLLAQIAL